LWRTARHLGDFVAVGGSTTAPSTNDKSAAYMQCAVDWPVYMFSVRLRFFVLLFVVDQVNVYRLCYAYPNVRSLLISGWLARTAPK